MMILNSNEPLYQPIAELYLTNQTFDFQTTIMLVELYTNLDEERGNSFYGQQLAKRAKAKHRPALSGLFIV